MKLDKKSLNDYLSKYFEEVKSKFIIRTSLGFSLNADDLIDDILSNIILSENIEEYFHTLKKNIKNKKKYWVKNTINGKNNSFALKMSKIKENDIRYKEIYDKEVEEIKEWQNNSKCCYLTEYKYFEDKTYRSKLEAIKSDITYYFLELILGDETLNDFIFRFQKFNEIPLAITSNCKELELIKQDNLELNVYADSKLSNVYNIVVPEKDLNYLKENNLTKSIFKLLNVTDVRVFCALFLNTDINFFTDSKIRISLSKLTNDVFNKYTKNFKQSILNSLYKLRYLQISVVSDNEPVYSINQKYAIDTSLIKAINRIGDMLEIEVGDYPKKQMLQGNLDLVCKGNKLKKNPLAETLAFYLNNKRINRMNSDEHMMLIITEKEMFNVVYFGDKVRKSACRGQILKALDLIKDLKTIIKDYSFSNEIYTIKFIPISEEEQKNMSKMLKSIIPSIVLNKASNSADNLIIDNSNISNLKDEEIDFSM